METDIHYMVPRESPQLQGRGREKRARELKDKTKLQLEEQRNGEKPDH